MLLSGLEHYNRWMASQLHALAPIQGTILEFGCGSGGMTRALLSLPGVRKLIANDISPFVKNHFSENFQGHPRLQFSDANIFSNPSSFRDMKYDLAVTSNTLEHIQEDAKALRAITENAREKTTLVLVPAFGWLYGTCDFDGGHLRRYTKKTFRCMAESEDLTVDSMKYFNMLGAFAWWFQYVLQKRSDYESQAHAKNYSLFNKFIVPLYSKLEKFFPCPFGLSLVARVSVR